MAAPRLDPDLAPIVDNASPALKIDFSKLEPFETAKQMRAAQIEADVPADPDIAVEDLEIAGPHGPIKLRVYRPKGAGRGALISFHGGGWVIGTIGTDHPRAMALARASGTIIISSDYRKSPEHSFPVPLDDARFAANWVADNADALGVDRAKLGLSGVSAGGNLAAAVALAMRDEGRVTPKFMYLLYPVTDADFSRGSYQDFAGGPVLTRNMMEWFWNQYVPNHADRDNPLASPARAASFANLPATLIQSAEMDPLRDEAEYFGVKLREAGVDVTCTRYAGGVHGFLNYGLNFPIGMRATAEAAQAVRAALA